MSRKAYWPVGTPNMRLINRNLIFNLKDKLAAYWTLDESSDGSGAVTREDAHINNLDLSDPDTVVSGTGKISNGANFVAANSETLVKTGINGTALDILDTSAWTVAGWIKPDDTTNFVSFFFWGRDNTQYCARVRFNAGKIEFICQNPSGVTVVGPSVSTGNWYFVAAGFDPATDVAKLWVNGTAYTGTQTATNADTDTDVFLLGRMPNGTYYDGLIDEVGAWVGKLLSDAELAWLYNAGNGRTYSQF